MTKPAELASMDQAKEHHNGVYGGKHHRHLLTHEILAGAVGFEAMRLFEEHQKAEGLPVHHKLAKELLAGFVAAECARHFEKGDLGHLDMQKALAAAQEQANYFLHEKFGEHYGLPKYEPTPAPAQPQ
ncbi:MAG: DUF3759 domain-containing protein [Actinobacteria bacterium]|nr:DUF3759 domain-containing protein [Actinomycetota bacterium]MBO0830952.1 DUF3759 domain-containing protein [Actinomycetota bacterium]